MEIHGLLFWENSDFKITVIHPIGHSILVREASDSDFFFFSIMKSEIPFSFILKTLNKNL